MKPDGSPMYVGPDGAPLDGMLIARCVITEKGNVEQCVILQNLFATKNEEFVATFQSQTFEPIVFEGKPQRVNFTFRLQFKEAEKYAEDLRKICRVLRLRGNRPNWGCGQWRNGSPITSRPQRPATGWPSFRRQTYRFGCRHCGETRRQRESHLAHLQIIGRTF